MPRKKKTRVSHALSGPQRLQRLLAAAGYGSRRQCEELIEAGRVEVDGEVVTTLGTTVDESVHRVRVDGVVLKKQKLVYFAVNKPVGVVTTNRDPQGRPRVVDLVPPTERVFPVGRLDRSSEGLILLTNDGELAQRLTHPKYGVRKVYRVTVAGKVDTETMRSMRKGVYIAEGFVRVEGAKLLKSRSRATELEIVLKEGKNREIRRILARLGHKVQQLRRIAVGPLRLGDVPPGAYRELRREEVEKLWSVVEAPESPDGDSRSTKRRPSKKVARSGKAGTGAEGKRGAKKRPAKKKTATRKKATATKTASQSYDFLPKETGNKIGAVIGGDAAAAEKPTKAKRKKSTRNTKRGAAKRKGPAGQRKGSPRKKKRRG